MLHTTLTPFTAVRRVVATFLLLVLAAAVGPATSANAAPPTAGGKALPIVLTTGPDGPVLPGGRLALVVPVSAFADRELLAALDAGARIDDLRVGEPEPQAGPYHDSTTWFWEVCFSITFPDGTSHEWCLSITIKVSTDVEGPVDGGRPTVLVGSSDGEPFKLCWDEILEDGTVVKHCIEITIETGSGDDEDEAAGDGPHLTSGTRNSATRTPSGR